MKLTMLDSGLEGRPARQCANDCLMSDVFDVVTIGLGMTVASANHEEVAL